MEGKNYSKNSKINPQTLESHSTDMTPEPRTGQTHMRIKSIDS